MKRICIQCGKEFNARGKRGLVAKFCSMECKGKFQIGKPNTSSTKFQKGNIPWCKGTKGIVKAWNKDKKMPQEYGERCSENMIELWKNPEYRKKMLETHPSRFGKLSAHWQGGKIETVCEYCGKEFSVFPYRKETAHFCSRSCRAKSRNGEKSGNWKGGITEENHKIRTSIEYQLWQGSVFTRDYWTCQKCGKKVKQIHAHHIQNFLSFPELRFAIDNGITFCAKCHRKFHKEYGNKDNNKEQLIEFLNNT